EIRGRLDELRAIDVVEGIRVEHGIAHALDHAGYDRDRAAGHANMEIRGLGSELIARHPRFVGNAQTKPALRMRGPGCPVLPTQIATTGADGDGGPGIRPLESHSNVAAMTSRVDAA